MIFFTWMALFFIRINPLLAQPNFPDDGEVFRDDVVPKIDIYIHPDPEGHRPGRGPAQGRTRQPLLL